MKITLHNEENHLVAEGEATNTITVTPDGFLQLAEVEIKNLGGPVIAVLAKVWSDDGTFIGKMEMLPLDIARDSTIDIDIEFSLDGNE